MKNISIFFLIYSLLFSSLSFAVDRKIQADIINPSISGNAVNLPKVQVDNLSLDANTAKTTSGDFVLDAAGVVKPNQDIVPNQAGLDLGSIGSPFQDIHSIGEHFGLKIENVTSGTIPASDPAKKGRLVYTTDTKKLYVDDGTAFIEAGGSGGGISEWLTTVTYVADDIVHTNNKIYKALVGHTAGTFATDLAAAKWVELSADSEAILTKGQTAGSAVSTKEIRAPHNQVTDLGSGVSLIETGSGNVLKDPGLEAATTSWTVTKNTVVASSPDVAMGGTPSGNLTVSNSTSSPLDGARSLVIVKANSVSVQGEQFKIPFTISPSMTMKVIRLSFDYAIVSGTYADNDIEWFVKDVTNGTIKPFTPSKLKKHTLVSERFDPNGEYQASDSTSYELIAHIASTSALDYSLKFDNFKLGVYGKTYGSVVTDPVTKTFTLTNAGNATVTGTVTERGSKALFEGRITIGSSLPTGLITLNLPSGYVLTSSGKYLLSTISGSSSVTSSATAWSSSTTSVQFYSNGSSSGWNATTPITWSAGQYIEFSFEADVAGRSSSQVMSSDADTRVVAAKMTSSDTTSFPSGSTTKATWSAVESDSHGMANIASDRMDIKVAGDYHIDAQVTFNTAASTVSDTVSMYAKVNGGTNYHLGTIGFPVDTQYRGVSGSTLLRGLKAGDYVEIYVGQSLGVSLTAYTLNSFSIARLSGPAQVAASESVSVLYKGAPPTGSITDPTVNTNLIFGTKIKDSHGAYNTATGVFTAPINGVYDFSSQVAINGTFALNSETNMYLVVNGVHVGYKENRAGGAIARFSPSIDLKSVPMLAGQTAVIRVYTNATSPVASSNSGENFISITRSGNY